MGRNKPLRTRHLSAPVSKKGFASRCKQRYKISAPYMHVGRAIASAPQWWIRRRCSVFQLKQGPPKGPSRGRRAGSDRYFRPGDTVRQSGIYEVLHDREHREVHEVVMISGDQFPSCETCHETVRFKLLRAATYIFYDQDFETGAE